MDVSGGLILQVLPNSCRGVGMGLTITTFWIVAFIMQSTLEPMFIAITTAGASCYLFRISNCFLPSVPLSLFFILFNVFAAAED